MTVPTRDQRRMIRGAAAIAFAAVPEWLQVVNQLCDAIDDLEAESAALEYLDSEATIGAELVNEELRQLRARVAYLERLIAKMDTHAPRADRRSVEPGITYSEACRRQLRDDGDPLFQEVCDD